MSAGCPVCAAPAVREFLAAPPHRILRCEVCAFCFIPRTSYASDPRELYGADAVSTAEYYTGSHDYDVRNFNELLATIERFERPSTLVDVGSSVGTFPRVAMARGWRVAAVEPNPRAAALAREQGVTVVEGRFSARLCSESGIAPVRVVTMNDVIEHVFDPMELLRAAHAALEPGGLAVVVTPDIDRYSCRRYQIKPEEHVCYFNSRSITAAMQRAGFEVLLCRPAPRLRDVVNVARNPTSRLAALDAAVVAAAVMIPPLRELLARLIKALVRDELIVVGRRAGARPAPPAGRRESP